MTRTRALLACGALTLSCATSAPDPPVARDAPPSAQSAIVEPPPRAPERIVPTPRPFLEHEACAAQMWLDDARPIAFEGAEVQTVADLTLRVQGPPGLAIDVDDPAHDGAAPPMEGASLTPLVALELPAGPARDEGAGASGALFDLGGAMLAGALNLIALPISLPIAVLIDRPDAMFVFSMPTFVDGMFADVVLPEDEWQREVERRARPYRFRLKDEADRQARFLAWRASVDVISQPRRCVLDADGRCSLHVRWASREVRATFSGLPCAIPPPEAPADASDEERYAATRARADASPSRLGFVPVRPPPRPPIKLTAEPRPPEDARGSGAVATADAWEHASDDVLIGPDVDAQWASAAKKVPVMSMQDGTLLCRVEARGSWDVDGSAPELRVRVAFGYDDDVTGRTFEFGSSRRAALGLRHVTFARGEYLKISLVDVDALVDDWGGMTIVKLDSALPIRFTHERFKGECRALAGISL